MATKRKTTKKEETIQPKEEIIQEEIIQEEVKQPKEEIKQPENKIKTKKITRFGVGDIVYISKKADADLNGFKLFPQYKKYTYTVEAYDEKSEVYTLRRLNLSLRLPEALILSPGEHAHDSINRRQF